MVMKYEQCVSTRHLPTLSEEVRLSSFFLPVQPSQTSWRSSHLRLRQMPTPIMRFLFYNID